MVPLQDSSPLTATLLAEYLALTGDRCPRCRGEVDPARAVCRSCAVPIRLGVSTTQSFAIAWAVALAGAALTAGFGSILAAMTFIRGQLPGSGSERPALIATLILGTTMAFAGAALLLWRRRFIRLPSALQWTLAIAALATIVVLFLWFASAIH